MFFLYNMSVRAFYLAAYVASFFNKKAKLWLDGRRKWSQELKEKLGTQKDLIWVHCSSLGEFEQGRPVIEKLNEKGEKVLLTFFSPSGYENLKNFQAAYHVTYLPLDTKKNAEKFISMVRPKAVLFVKYEFWFNFIRTSKKAGIPLFLISGIFRPEHYFFKWYGFWARKQLRNFTRFFLQDGESQKLLNEIRINNTDVCGDSRFDRVYEISKKPKDVPEVEHFGKDFKLLIAGSTWKEDEVVLNSFLSENSDYKLVIAPHEVDESRISSIHALFGQCQNISSYDTNKDCRVLIIDKIGLLSCIYRYGKIAFIGGGFGKGIHNTLEAAVFGLPVIFGPNYSKFREARELIEKKAAFSINEGFEMKEIIAQNDMEKAGEMSARYVRENVGATDFILRHLEKEGILKTF